MPAKNQKTKSRTAKSSLAKKARFKFRWWMAVILVVVVAGVGALVLRFSHAATPGPLSLKPVQYQSAGSFVYSVVPSDGSTSQYCQSVINNGNPHLADPAGCTNGTILLANNISLKGGGEVSAYPQQISVGGRNVTSQYISPPATLPNRNITSIVYIDSGPYQGMCARPATIQYGSDVAVSGAITTLGYVQKQIDDCKNVARDVAAALGWSYNVAANNLMYHPVTSEVPVPIPSTAFGTPSITCNNLPGLECDTGNWNLVAGSVGDVNGGIWKSPVTGHCGVKYGPTANAGYLPPKPGYFWQVNCPSGSTVPSGGISIPASGSLGPVIGASCDPAQGCDDGNWSYWNNDPNVWTNRNAGFNVYCWTRSTAGAVHFVNPRLCANPYQPISINLPSVGRFGPYDPLIHQFGAPEGQQCIVDSFKAGVFPIGCKLGPDAPISVISTYMGHMNSPTGNKSVCVTGSGSDHTTPVHVTVNGGPSNGRQFDLSPFYDDSKGNNWCAFSRQIGDGFNFFDGLTISSSRNVVIKSVVTAPAN